MKIDTAIKNALANRDITQIPELISTIRRQTKTTLGEDEIQEAVDEYLLKTGIINITLSWEHNTVVYRESLFENTSFRVRLTDSEINAKRLNFGHRFIPYINPTIHPTELVFKDENKKDIPFREEVSHLQDVNVFFSLMPPYGFDNYLLDSDGTINLYHLDLTEWINNNKFTNRDRIIISPIDYKKNIFLLEKETAREFAEQKLLITQKDDALEEAILDTIAFEENPIPADLVLFKALAECEPALIENPGSAVGPLVSQSESLQIYHDTGFAYIHRVDFHNETFSNLMDEAMFPNMEKMGEATDLEGIFTELGNSFSSSFIKGKFIQQLLKSGETDKEEVCSFIFKNEDERFFNEQQESNFNQALEALNVHTKKEWTNKTLPLVVNNLLSKVLSFKVEIVELLREIDANLTDPANFDFAMLFQLQPFEQITDRIIEDITAGEKITAKDASELSKQIDMLRSRFKEASADILKNM